MEFLKCRFSNEARSDGGRHGGTLGDQFLN